MDGEKVGTGIEKVGREERGRIGHQVDVKRDGSVGADCANQVWKKEQAGNEVAVGGIEMEGVGPGGETAYGGFQIGEVGGPERYVGEEAIGWQVGPAGHVSG